MTPEQDAEIAALKIILSNVVARLAITVTEKNTDAVRAMLASMTDECKLAAEQTVVLGRTSAERSQIVNATLTHIDEFFKGLTIT
jgi:hypothetical protein